ncbi:PTS sugar transporter subunit IIA [Terribacillus sp. DMT04]|uniref:PTS sugar transporter subunit IIA n=1 Tax=Terribacillus sp. DMT04 TaxID=2850441 RepID=UPI001C2BD414|nr:PTS sugar transporter subunit IIA [Terribacillus sp. DMT04]QXE01890.1 PTS sugar transporter subunit IIA [Terribacillus sp. DMT04]
MQDDSFYQIYFNAALSTKNEVFAFLSNVAWLDDPLQKEAIVKQLIQREGQGSMLIAEHVVLPHIESNKVEKSQIILIRLLHSIEFWDSETKDIRLIIGVLLKENEDVQIKQKIASFMRTLADEEYVDQLLTIEKEADFYKQIKR